MWKTLIASTLALAGQSLAQMPVPGVAALAPYIEAVAAVSAYPPGPALKSLHLANYDDASHRALVREAFTASIFGGASASAARLGDGGSAIPTGARWSERRYLFATDQRCEVFINVGEVSAAMARALPRYEAFSVWHELAHCMLLEQANADASGHGAAARATALKLEAVLAEGQGQLAYTLLNEAIADSFALLVEASVRGRDAARDMARALLRYRRQEQARQDEDPGSGAHDTRFALELVLAALDAGDLSAVDARERCALAMKFASDGTLRWARERSGEQAAAALRPLFDEFAEALARGATGFAAPAASKEIPVFLAHPGGGRQSALRIM